MKQNLIAILNLLCVSLFVCSVIIFNQEPIYAGLCMSWAVIYFVKTNKHMLVWKAFTLVELVAVIAIAGILLSILISFKSSPTKSDAIRLNALLIQAKTYSLTCEYPVKFELTDNYKSKITQTEDLYLLKGVPVAEDGAPLVGFRFYIVDKQETEKPIQIKLKPFTGKITFY
jgi:prepilin-type N-terminal cleavage/methylation domain-containing protein